ncbi:MAG: hypothetical protein JRI34_09950 [Deltaproteobacteria bacterium]|nr:hypothetical protein [Deltaproteobacteria bacterium]
MADSLPEQLSVGQANYADQINRLAWREKMLAQILNKVRTVSPEANQGQPALPAHPTKGYLLDVYI